MLLSEQEFDVRAPRGSAGLIEHYEEAVQLFLPEGHVPVRFAVTGSEGGSPHCELGALAGLAETGFPLPGSIFDFAPRRTENHERFNAVLVVPTGIGAEIGGHAGDAGPVARLLASACDTLVTHPNVMNASDINELPGNALYVEGSVVSRLLMGTAGLQKVRANRVLLVMDQHECKDIEDLVVNGASAARMTLGLDCPAVVKMEPSPEITAEYASSGRAVGRIEHMERLCDVLRRHRGDYDAVAVNSLIDMPDSLHSDYFTSAGEIINPWGGVEAMLTHAVSMLFDVPSAHAPMVDSVEILNTFLGVVDPRMAAEAVSNVFLHSVLKGLHRSPRIVTDPAEFRSPGVLSAADVSCLVIPDGCVGLPTLAALEQGIPVIAVRENRNVMRNDLRELPFERGKLFVVDNYLEAVGVMAGLKAGVSPATVRRPLSPTRVSTDASQQDAEVSTPPRPRPAAEVESGDRG